MAGAISLIESARSPDVCQNVRRAAPRPDELMTETDPPPLRKIPAPEFASLLGESEGQPDRHYVFWLGAGCSVTSHIPAAEALVRDIWLPRLHRRQNGTGSVDEWASRTFSGYTPDNAGAFYGPVMEALFLNNDARRRETERLCDGRLPGFGYGVLASLMSRNDGFFSTAITTNFDDLVADAMYVFGKKRPLVIQHESLAGFVRPGHVQRPLVVKIHGDHRLNPMHTAQETEALDPGVADGIRGLLQDRGVIFIGYSGNDDGVIKALDELPGDALPLGVWWVSRKGPTGKICTWLQSRRAFWVQAGNFDEMMLLLRDAFGLEHPNQQKFAQMFKAYLETYERLRDKVAGLSDTADSRPLKEAVQRASDDAPDWWRILTEARSHEMSDPDRADQLYREGVDASENTQLLYGYASFLWERHRDPDRAQELFERALRLDPDEPLTLSNYATFMWDERNNPDRAEELFERALRLVPNASSTLKSYVFFLWAERGDLDRAKQLYEQALDLDPNDSVALRGYAFFLWAKQGDLDRARGLYERALHVNPDDAIASSYYAIFEDRHGNPDRARELLEQAIELDPDNAHVLGNGALLLLKRREDRKAYKMIDRALSDIVKDRHRRLDVRAWFYLLALGPGDRREGALTELAALVNAGTRSQEWDFGGILARARDEGRLDIEWLEWLADVITGRADADVLYGWDEWPSM
jgi:Tfp pilus assembly protein PilF